MLAQTTGEQNQAWPSKRSAKLQTTPRPARTRSKANEMARPKRERHRSTAAARPGKPDDGFSLRTGEGGILVNENTSWHRPRASVLPAPSTPGMAFARTSGFDTTHKINFITEHLSVFLTQKRGILTFNICQLLNRELVV